MEKRQFTVYGRVQGVAFRFYTHQQAKKLELKGYVKNLSDGAVLVVAQGNAQQVNAMRQWLHIGSPASRVDQIIEQEYAGAREFEKFMIEI